MINPNLVNTGSVVMLCFVTPPDGGVPSAWFLRLNDDSAGVVTASLHGHTTDGMWAEIKAAMLMLADNVSMQKVTLSDGSVVERDDAEAM